MALGILTGSHRDAPSCQSQTCNDRCLHSKCQSRRCIVGVQLRNTFLGMECHCGAPRNSHRIAANHRLYHSNLGCTCRRGSRNDLFLHIARNFLRISDQFFLRNRHSGDRRELNSEGMEMVHHSCRWDGKNNLLLPPHRECRFERSLGFHISLLQKKTIEAH